MNPRRALRCFGLTRVVKSFGKIAANARVVFAAGADCYLVFPTGGMYGRISPFVSLYALSSRIALSAGASGSEAVISSRKLWRKSRAAMASVTSKEPPVSSSTSGFSTQTRCRNSSRSRSAFGILLTRSRNRRSGKPIPGQAGVPLHDTRFAALPLFSGRNAPRFLLNTRCVLRYHRPHRSYNEPRGAIHCAGWPVTWAIRSKSSS